MRQMKFVVLLAAALFFVGMTVGLAQEPGVALSAPGVASVEANSSRAQTREMWIWNTGSDTLVIEEVYAYADSVTLNNPAGCVLISAQHPSAPPSADDFTIISTSWQAVSEYGHLKTQVQGQGWNGKYRISPAQAARIAVACPVSDGSVLNYLVFEPSAITYRYERRWATSIKAFSFPVVPIGICGEGGSGVTAQFPNGSVFETTLPHRGQGAKAWLFGYQASGQVYFRSLLTDSLSGLTFGGHPFAGGTATAYEVTNPQNLLPGGKYHDVIAVTATGCYKSYASVLNVPY